MKRNRGRITLMLVSMLLSVTIAGCYYTVDSTGAGNEPAGVSKEDNTENPEENSDREKPENAAAAEDTADTKEAETSDTTQTEAEEKEDNVTENDVTVRVSALKGPTTIGLVNLIADAGEGKTSQAYEFNMFTAGSDVMAEMAAGKTDIGLVPANVAAVMNNKIEGGVSVIDINTLGVLYCVTGNGSVSGIGDLSGQTVYMTGQGATPEYTMRYLLKQNEVTDCNIEFKSEPTEIASLLSEDPQAIAVLPQPFVTVAEMQNEALKTAFSLDDAWAKVNTDCSIITGVTVVANSFLNEHPDSVAAFIKDHKASAQMTADDPDKTAALVVEQGIIPKEPIAKKAIPECSVVCISGNEMKDLLSGYLKVMFEEEPKSVGGTLPEDDFYCIIEE